MNTWKNLFFQMVQFSVSRHCNNTPSSWLSAFLYLCAIPENKLHPAQQQGIIPLTTYGTSLALLQDPFFYGYFFHATFFHYVWLLLLIEIYLCFLWFDCQHSAFFALTANTLSSVGKSQTHVQVASSATFT